MWCVVGVLYVVAGGEQSGAHEVYVMQCMPKQNCFCRWSANIGPPPRGALWATPKGVGEEPYTRLAPTTACPFAVCALAVCDVCVCTVYVCVCVCDVCVCTCCV